MPYRHACPARGSATQAATTHQRVSDRLEVRMECAEPAPDEGDEGFVAESETTVNADGVRVATDTGAPVTWTEEQTYFFRLSAYADKLLAHYDLGKFRTLFLAGERADPDTVMWAENLLKVPVIDHWWQTETGWCIAGNPVGLGALPVKYGSATVPACSLYASMLSYWLRRYF